MGLVSGTAIIRRFLVVVESIVFTKNPQRAVLLIEDYTKAGVFDICCWSRCNCVISSMPPIVISEHGPPASAALEFLANTTQKPDSFANDSPLLKAIKTVLRGTDAAGQSSIHTTRFFTGNDAKDYELTWNAQHAILTYSGVIIKRWCFDHEGESIQWACLGEIEQVVVPNSKSGHSAANSATSENKQPAEMDAGRPIFGPFHRETLKRAKKDDSYTTIVLCVFIFLRSVGKMYLMDGTDYTFSLPFIVRRVWSVSPHGVMMQRVLEPSELIEAETNGEEVLPTIFTLTSPFSEAAAVGHTAGILNATQDLPATLKDEEEHLTKPLRSIPPTEMIVWVSHWSLVAGACFVVTVDVKKRLLSIWHYVHIKWKGLAFTRNAGERPRFSEKAKGKQRQSFSGADAGNRRTSLFDGVDGRQRTYPASPGVKMPDPPMIPLEFFDLPDALPLASLPGMPPSLSTTMTMASLVSSTATQKKSTTALGKGRRSSLSRNDLSSTMDRMVLGGRTDDSTLLPVDLGRMKASYWMECLFTQQISEEECVNCLHSSLFLLTNVFSTSAKGWSNILVNLFDTRFDGKQHRCLMSIGVPKSQLIHIFSLAGLEDRTVQVSRVTELPGLSAASLRATRANVWDLLFVKPRGELVLLTHGLQEIPVQLRPSPELSRTDIDMDASTSRPPHGMITSIREAFWGNVTLVHEDGWESLATFDIFPQNKLVTECFQLLALTLPNEVTFEIRRLFLEKWCERGWSTCRDVEFNCFSITLLQVFGLEVEGATLPDDPWARLAASSSYSRFVEDSVLSLLQQPPTIPVPRPIPNTSHPTLAPVLYGFHILAEQFRFSISRHQDLLKFVPLLCRIAVAVRPEWADYWKRLVPDAITFWSPSSKSCRFKLSLLIRRLTTNSSQTAPECLDDRIPVWPPDFSAILHGHISKPDWKVPWQDVQHIVSRFCITPSFEYGLVDPLRELHELSLLYNSLADDKVPECQRRAENAVSGMVALSRGRNFIANLPLGIAAPLCEATRTCQLAPPTGWSHEAYQVVGRNDLAASMTNTQDVFVARGYKRRKEFIVRCQFLVTKSFC